MSPLLVLMLVEVEVVVVVEPMAEAAPCRSQLVAKVGAMLATVARAGGALLATDKALVMNLRH